jgi:chondroitin 4-sulfotransferase 11/chondroitin 4-sulfotransferase 13/dermatan 4-sulfotransferase 1
MDQGAVPQPLQSIIAAIRRRGVSQHVLYIPKFNLVYFQVPKVASTSLRSFLYAKMLEGSGTPQDYIDRVTRHPRAPGLNISFCHLYQYTDAQFNAILTDRNIKKFTVVRDPYTRALSAYRDKVVRKHFAAIMEQDFKHLFGKTAADEISFDEFCVYLKEIHDTMRPFNQHFKPQWQFLGSGTFPFDKIIRFENLDAELTEFFREVGLAWEGKKLAPHGTGSNDRNDISQQARDILREIYRDDFVRLGYPP